MSPQKSPQCAAPFAGRSSARKPQRGQGEGIKEETPPFAPEEARRGEVPRGLTWRPALYLHCQPSLLMTCKAQRRSSRRLKRLGRALAPSSGVPLAGVNAALRPRLRLGAPAWRRRLRPRGRRARRCARMRCGSALGLPQSVSSPR
jgi:hypothetical protein